MYIPIMHDSDRYELVRDFGSRNFGVARMMRDKQTKELVAVKYIDRGEKVSVLINLFSSFSFPFLCFVWSVFDDLLCWVVGFWSNYISCSCAFCTCLNFVAVGGLDDNTWLSNVPCSCVCCLVVVLLYWFLEYKV